MMMMIYNQVQVQVQVLNKQETKNEDENVNENIYCLENTRFHGSTYISDDDQEN